MFLYLFMPGEYPLLKAHTSPGSRLSRYVHATLWVERPCLCIIKSVVLALFMYNKECSIGDTNHMKNNL